MFNELIKKISSTPINFISWLLSAIGIIIIRIFLEQYSSNIPGHFVLIDLSTIIHYIAFYIAVLLWCMAIIIYFTKISLEKASIISLFGLMLIWLAPIIDLVLSGGKGYLMFYLFAQSHDLIKAFFTEFWSTSINGITYGIRIEIIILIIASFKIIYSYTKNISKSIYGAILIYVGIFTACSLPSMLGIFQKIPINIFMEQSIFDSNIVSNSTFNGQFGYLRLFEVGFNSLMTQTNLILIFIGITLICLFTYGEKTKIILKNARPERILHYTLLIIIGSLFGARSSFFHSWINVLSLILTIIAFIFAWLAAVCANDIHDEKIDTISNKNRPIPSGLFSKDEFHQLTKIFLLISLITAYSASWYELFFVILFSIAYYIYTAPPLKLKRHYIGGIIVIGFTSISAFSSGFFLANSSKELLSLSPLLVLSIGLIFGLSSMIKDIKDYEGDKANNIKTLPVVIGLKVSKIVIASIITAGIIGISIFLGKWIIMPFTAIASTLIWKILLAKIFKE